MASRNEPVPWSVAQRAGVVYGLLLNVRSDVPGMYESSYATAAGEFSDVLNSLKSIDADLASLEAQLERLGAPHTPGRVPEWTE